MVARHRRPEGSQFGEPVLARRIDFDRCRLAVDLDEASGVGECRLRPGGRERRSLRVMVGQAAGEEGENDGALGVLPTGLTGIDDVGDRVG